MSEEIEYTVGSGNVFADLGFPDPEDALRRCMLACRLSHTIEEKGLSHAKAAAMLGIEVEVLKKIVRGRLSNHPVEELTGYLNLMGVEVEPFTIDITEVRAKGEPIVYRKPTEAEIALHQAEMAMQGYGPGIEPHFSQTYQLKHIQSTVCPICGARTKYEEQKSQHCNGEWFEERGFECGARLDYVPNFSRVQEGKPCPNHPDQQRMKRRRQLALNSVFDFIAGLDVDEEFKNHLRRYL